MIELSKIIGFTLTLSDTTLVATPYAGNRNISQYEEVILECDATAITQALSINLKLSSDYFEVNDVYMEPLVERPGIFQVRLNEVIGKDLVFGEEVETSITIGVATESTSYETTNVFSYKLYKTSLDELYTPNDIDVLFTTDHKIIRKLAEVEKIAHDKSEGQGEFDPNNYVSVLPKLYTTNEKIQARRNIDATAVYFGTGTMPEGYDIMFDITEDDTPGVFQTISITDPGDYFTTKTVEGALQEIGAELNGLADALEAL